MFTLEVETEIEGGTLPVRKPKLYCLDDGPLCVRWVAEGTDGNLYLVPCEAAGWLRRMDYNGPYGELTPVCPDNACSIVWFVYGDIGQVTIAGH